MSEAQERLRYLEGRVRFLEDRLRALRASRRVLMNLIALREEERRLVVEGLTRENDRLRARNRKYARALLASRRPGQG